MKSIFSILIAISLISIKSASAGLLDGFKDSSDLMLNQKKCLYVNQVQGEMVDGKFLYRNTRVIAEFKKLGKERISFKRLVNLDEGETAPVLVLTVYRKNNQLYATISDGTIVLSCSI
ncbi:MAG: hypothetical protein RLZZ410_1607 [Pseudomonadota bacterium]|jgi:hypothetical protein